MQRRPRLVVAAGLGADGACAVFAGLVAAGRVSAGSGPWFAAAVACVVVIVGVTGAVAFLQCDRSWRALVISPCSIAAVTWLVLFVVRPLELYVSPDQAAQSLAQFGFRLSDLTRAVALGAVGAAAWSIGYLLALGHVPNPLSSDDPSKPLAIAARRAYVVLAAGVALWGLLFLRQGGIRRLIHSAVEIRLNQSASFYGFVGLWMVQGVALFAFAATVRSPTRSAKLVLAAAAVASILGALALQVRGLAVFAALAAAAVYLSVRRVSARGATVAVVAGVCAVLALGYAQQVRQYTAQRSLASSIRLAGQTPFASWYISDLSTYDNLVAVRELVPGSLGYLDGSTIREIPAALVPRSVWPGKPRGIDVRAASYLYPGSNAAVAISLQGELYWNGGVAGVALGGFLIGALFGLLAAVGLRTRPASGAFVLYAVAAAFTHAFLTRGLATMTENLIFALVGVGIALWAMALERPQLAWLRAGATASGS